MRRYLLGITVALVAALAAPTAPAGATPPSGVEIEADTLLAGTGTFTATGAAVDDGVLCASGDTLDVFGKRSGMGPKGFNVQVVKEFTCADGSGSFLVKLQVKVFSAGPVLSSFNWVVMDGDGAYSDLHGSGDGVGLPPNPGFDILDVYAGQMHID
jgi:hypothetical protein